jgi:hypothetical protein
MFSSQTVHSKHHSIFIPIDRPVKPVGLRHPRFSPIDMTGEMGGVGQEREHVREVAKSLIKCMAHVQGSVVTCKRCKGILMPEVIHCRPRSSSIDSTTSGISEKDAERAVGAGLAVEGVSKYSSRIKAFLGEIIRLEGEGDFTKSLTELFEKHLESLSSVISSGSLRGGVEGVEISSDVLLSLMHHAYDISTLLDKAEFSSPEQAGNASELSVSLKEQTDALLRSLIR